jgi:hypothetical protein
LCLSCSGFYSTATFHRRQLQCMGTVLWCYCAVMPLSSTASLTSLRTLKFLSLRYCRVWTMMSVGHLRNKIQSSEVLSELLHITKAIVYCTSLL